MWTSSTTIAGIGPPPTVQPTTVDCAWWNLACQGASEVADSSLNAITESMVNGLVALFGQITKIVDESTRVPLADPTYRETYYGFAGLAVPVIAAVYFIALLSAAFHRDPRALLRATVGVAVSSIGGLVYVLFAQLIVAADDWLAHGVVSVTGGDFGQQMKQIAEKFELMGGVGGAVAANFLMLILMFAALLAGVVLWVILLLRKMAILVVVAFAPLLIAGWLWPPTRSWSRRATEVLIALVFCKSVIYVIFGIGMSLLLRDSQSLSDFVGVVVLLCGACFAPLVMLRLVHFAADSQLAGEMVGTLRSGAQPTLNRINQHSRPGASRSQMARDYAAQAKGSSQAPRANSVPLPGGGGQAATSGSSAASGSGAAAAGARAGAAAGPAGVAVGATAAAVSEGVSATQRVAGSVARAAEAVPPGSDPSPPTSPGPSVNNERE